MANPTTIPQAVGAAAVPATPMKLVPVEPTEEQLQAGMAQWDGPTRHQVRSTYKAMLDAAPASTSAPACAHGDFPRLCNECRPLGRCSDLAPDAAPAGERPLFDPSNPAQGYVSDAEWAARRAAPVGEPAPLTVHQTHNMAPKGRLRCEQCGKLVNEGGLRHHRTAVHGSPDRATPTGEAADERETEIPAAGGAWFTRAVHLADAYFTYFMADQGEVEREALIDHLRKAAERTSAAPDALFDDFPEGPTPAMREAIAQNKAMAAARWARALDELLAVESGPFKGKPQQWFTRAEVIALLASGERTSAPAPEGSAHDELVAALTLAANRLARCALEGDARFAFGCSEWEREARATIAKFTKEPTHG